VRSDCSFCWYWWNCWLSLFIFPCHNYENTTHITQTRQSLSAWELLHSNINAEITKWTEDKRAYQVLEVWFVIWTHVIWGITENRLPRNVFLRKPMPAWLFARYCQFHRQESPHQYWWFHHIWVKLLFQVAFNFCRSVYIYNLRDPEVVICIISQVPIAIIA